MRKNADFEDVTVKKVPKRQKVKKPRGIFSLSGKRINPLRTMRTRFSFAIFIIFVLISNSYLPISFAAGMTASKYPDPSTYFDFAPQR